MKKILPILMLAFTSLFIISCDNTHDNVQTTDSDTVALMRDVNGSFNGSNNFAFTQAINIQSTDVVLVYRKDGNAWQMIPKTYYLDNVSNLPTNRELDYNFVFDAQNVQIRTEANFNQSTEITNTEASQYLNNQTFRIVLVPANANKGTAAVDYSDYNAVVKYYHLNDTKVPITKAK